MCFDVLCLTKELRFVEERARCKEEHRAGQQTAVIKRKVRLTQRREYERYLSSIQTSKQSHKPIDFTHSFITYSKSSLYHIPLVRHKREFGLVGDHLLVVKVGSRGPIGPIHFVLFTTSYSGEEE
jgi:hypothetical protein